MFGSRGNKRGAKGAMSKRKVRHQSSSSGGLSVGYDRVSPAVPEAKPGMKITLSSNNTVGVGLICEFISPIMLLSLLIIVFSEAGRCLLPTSVNVVLCWNKLSKCLVSLLVVQAR